MTYQDHGCPPKSAVNEFTACLEFWRNQLLSDDAEGDSSGTEFDRRVLDYYLDEVSSNPGLLKPSG
jgi:hypothetical protein